jgi:5'-nucleotidase / UDP-sugar diphosphatase
LAVLAIASLNVGCVDFNVQCTPDVSDPNNVTGYLGQTSNGQPVSLNKLAVRSGDNTMGQLLTESYFHSYDQVPGVDTSKLPALAVENSGSIRTDCRDSLSPGLVLRGWLRQIIPFDDVIYSFPATFQEIDYALEHSVGFIAKTGSPPNENPSAGFLQIYGVVVQVDCSQPAEVLDDSGNLMTPGKRVRSIQVMSRASPTKPLCKLDFTGTGTSDCPGQYLWVGANEYLYGGGDGYTSFGEISTSSRDAEKLSAGITNFNAASTYWDATYGSASTPFPGDPAARWLFSNCVFP